MTGRFPVPAPDDGDPRFTFGLLLDVAKVLAAHGFPDMTTAYDGVGADLVELRQALFRFLYMPPVHKTVEES